MKMSYIITGTSIIIIGTGIYFLIKKLIGFNSYTVDYKDTDVINLSDIGEWLKTLDVDIEDLGKSRRIFVIKNVKNSFQNLNLPKDIIAKLADSSSKEVLAITLSDMENNTKRAIILVGNSIDEKFKEMLNKEVVELNIKW